MIATQSEAHREWHQNAGVPMGVAGCPQDACHPPDDWEDWEDSPSTPTAPVLASTPSSPWNDPLPF